MAQLMLQIRDKLAVQYWQADPGCAPSVKRTENMKSVRAGRYSGKMTQGSAKRMTKAITLMSMATKGKTIYNPIIQRMVHHHLSFITLTVSDSRNIRASEASETLLQPFLQWLRRTRKVECYIWKAELQKRGQIHYHIISPLFIPYDELRDEWNDLQRKAGYLDEYAKKHGHFKPNSTDIHAVSKKRNTTNYLVKSIQKEMTKSVNAIEVQVRADMKKTLRNLKFQDTRATTLMNSILIENRYSINHEIKKQVGIEITLDGKTWDCSDNLSRAQYFTLYLNKDHLNQIDTLKGEMTLRVKEDDFFKLIFFTNSSPPDILNDAEKKELDEYLQSILN